MTTDNSHEPSNVLPPVVNNQTIPAAQVHDPALDLPSALPAALPQEYAVPPLMPIPDEAAESDLIEKEWVDKAKQIVEHTVDDPFTQQEELSKMKADYLKKRYNKDLGEA